MKYRLLTLAVCLAAACGGGGGGGGTPPDVPPAGVDGPQVSDLRISMVSDTSATLSWTTRDGSGPVVTHGEVRYRRSAGGTEVVAQDVRGSAAGTTHYVRLTGLQRATSYAFTVYVDGTIATSGTVETARSLNPLSGEVDLTPLKVKARVIQGGSPLAEAIVYLRLRHATGETSTLLSAIPDTAGGFLLQSNFARTATGGGWFDVDGPGGDTTQVEVVTGGAGIHQWEMNDGGAGTTLDLGTLEL